MGSSVSQPPTAANESRLVPSNPSPPLLCKSPCMSVCCMLACTLTSHSPRMYMILIMIPRPPRPCCPTCAPAWRACSCSGPRSWRRTARSCPRAQGTREGCCCGEDLFIYYLLFLLFTIYYLPSSLPPRRATSQPTAHTFLSLSLDLIALHCTIQCEIGSCTPTPSPSRACWTAARITCPRTSWRGGRAYATSSRKSSSR